MMAELNVWGSQGRSLKDMVSKVISKRADGQDGMF